MNKYSSKNRSELRRECELRKIAHAGLSLEGMRSVLRNAPERVVTPRFYGVKGKPHLRINNNVQEPEFGTGAREIWDEFDAFKGRYGRIPDIETFKVMAGVFEWNYTYSYTLYYAWRRFNGVCYVKKPPAERKFKISEFERRMLLGFIEVGACKVYLPDLAARMGLGYLNCRACCNSLVRKALVLMDADKVYTVPDLVISFAKAGFPGTIK